MPSIAPRGRAATPSRTARARALTPQSPKRRAVRAPMFRPSGASHASPTATSSASDNKRRGSPPAAASAPARGGVQSEPLPAPAAAAAPRWAGTSMSDEVGASSARDSTSSSSGAAAMRAGGANLRGVPGVAPGIRRPSKTRAAADVEYVCPHEDCRRVFHRKTSLTNHVKAHKNVNSRSILRTKRMRRQAQLAQINALKRNSQTQAAQALHMSQLCAQTAALRAKERVAQMSHNRYYPQTQAQTQHMQQALHRQHHQQQNSIPQPQPVPQHLPGEAQMGALAARPPSLPWSALTVSPEEEVGGGYCGREVAQSPELCTDYASVGAAGGADLKLEAQFAMQASLSTQTGLDGSLGSGEEMYVPMTPSASILPPWGGIGTQSFAIASEVLPYERFGVDTADLGGECVPFGEFQGECEVGGFGDANYLHNFETLRSFVLPENSAAGF